MNKKFYVLVLVWWTCAQSVWAQTTFFAISASDGQHIPFELTYEDQVYFSDSLKLELDIKEETTVTVRATGHETARKKVKPNKTYHIVLSPTTIDLSEVVVTDVHSIKKRHQTVLNVSRISSRKIEQIGAFDLRDALTFENNIRLRRDNALGSSALSLMGMSGNNVKIMVDGVPVIGRLFDQIDLEQFNLNNTQQIEIIKGPMSVIYGSNALAGTINIITNSSFQKKANARASYETDGQYNVTSSINIPFENHAFNLSAGRLLFDGWSANDTDRTFDWIPKVQYSAGLNYQYRRDSFTAQIKSEYLNSFLLDRGAPLAPYKEFAVDQKYSNLRYDNNIKLNWNFKNSNLNIIAGNNYFKRFKNKYYKNLLNLSETLIPISSEQDTQSFNAFVFRSIYGFSHKHYETLFGLDINSESGTGSRIKEQQQEQSDIALFTSTEFKINPLWIVRTGVRYAYNTAFSSPLLYSLQSRLTLSGSRVIKVAYGKGFRAPSLKELYLDFYDSRHAVYGNDALLPETSHSFTASYQKFYRWSKVSSNWTAELFYNRIKNKIELLVLGPLEATYGNIGLYETVGGNLSQNLMYKKFRMNTSFGYTGIFNGLEGQSSKFSFSPQLVVQPGYYNNDKEFGVNLFVNYFGALSRVFEDSTTGEQSVQEMDAYTMMDISANKRLFNKRLQLTAGIRNLVGIRQLGTTVSQAAHTESSTSVTISPGRTFFITVKYEFFK